MGRIGMTTTGIAITGVLAAGCTGSSGHEGAPNFVPTTGAAEAPAWPSPEAAGPPPAPTTSPEKAGDIGSVIMGTITGTKDRYGDFIGVWAFEGPYSKETNGSFAEGDEVPLECYVIGREGSDPNVPTYPTPYVWNQWDKVVGTLGGEQQWLPDIYVATNQPLPECPDDLSAPSTD